MCYCFLVMSFQVSASDFGVPSESALVKVIIKVLPVRNSNIVVLSSGDEQNGNISGHGNSDSRAANAASSIINSAPVFRNSDEDRMITVAETEKIGRMLVLIDTEDADGDTVCVHIVDTPGSDNFAIFDNRALVLARQLDYEIQTEYSLTILLTDGHERVPINVS